MYKTMLLIKKRSSLSMQDFIKHYESVHAPLATRLVPGLKKYARHFLRPATGDLNEIAEQQVHVVTEMWYEDKSAFDTAMAKLAEPETAGAVDADGALLFEPQTIQFMVVECHDTDLGT